MRIIKISNNIQEIIDSFLDEELIHPIILLEGSTSNLWKDSIIELLEKSNFNGIIFYPEFDEANKYDQVIELQNLRLISDFIFIWNDEDPIEDFYIEVINFWKNNGNLFIGGKINPILLEITELEQLHYYRTEEELIDHFNEIKEVDPIRLIHTEDGGLVESGPLKINNDIPGYFLRSDSAMNLSTAILKYLDPKTDKKEKELYRPILENFGKSLLKIK